MKLLHLNIRTHSHVCHVHSFLIIVIIVIIHLLHLFLHHHLPLLLHVHDPAAHADHRLLHVGVVAPHGHVVGHVRGARGLRLPATLTETRHVSATATDGDGKCVEGDLPALNNRILVI